ncbi:MAG: hypothetical protein EOM62_11700 [Bacteroidia bacterium]|nr:hypothetical protein [Bacteroidia bacterium]
MATAKTEAINAALANATELLNTLKGGYTGTLKELNDKIVAQAALITVLQGNVTTLGTDLDAAEVQIAANKAAIALQKAILDKYFNTASPDDIPTALAAIKADLAAANVDIDALSDRIDAIDTALNVLDFNVNSMITEVSFDYAYDDISARYRNLYFTTTPAQLNYTFATGVTNAITFVKGQRQTTAGVTIVAKVSPANADLSKMVDKIKLIRSDANAQINNYVVATKAERATPLLTRATPTATGLWSITFELPTSSDLTEVTKLVKAPAPSTSEYLFALAIENTVDAADDAEDRFVISDFGVTIRANNVAPIYNLAFDAKNSTDAAWTAHTAIRNRNNVMDPVSAAPLTDKAWSPIPWVTTSTAVADADPTEVRAGQPLLNVEVAKEFNVRITNPSVYAYYVTLDKDYAVESIPSEINAWNAYQYEGLNTLYKADEVAKIKINSPSAAGDIIGFRVIAVNWDGTLVDPDGKSFYVGVGASLSSTLAFKQTITAPLTVGTAVASDILAFASPAGVAVASAEFSMALEHSQTLTTANLVQYSATSGVATTTDWAATKRLQITGAIPANLKENTAYTATLTLKNAAGIPVFVQNITLTKVLPTADLGITYKTSIHHDVAGQQVIYGYPLPSKYYDVTTALNVPAAMTDLAVTNNSTYAAASLPTWNQAATPVNFGNTASIVPVAEIGVPYLPAAAPGHGKIYDLTLSRNYGPVKYSATVPAGANYLLNWNGTPALKVEFRSFVQDLSDWKYTNAGTVVEGNVPVLKYGTALTGYALANITALPPAGARIGLTNVAPFGLQDGRTYTITDINVLTGANFTVVNEYFEPVPGAGSTINFNPVITSVPAANVPSKLEVTLTDSFGHAYTFVVPKVFDMTPN